MKKELTDMDNNMMIARGRGMGEGGGVYKPHK